LPDLLAAPELKLSEAQLRTLGEASRY
jgi:hypothetical protein